MSNNSLEIARTHTDLNALHNENAALKAELERIHAEAAGLKSSVEILRVAADRLQALRALMGYVQNGTHETVKLYQDDATMSFYVHVGKQYGYGDSLGEAIDDAENRIK